MSLGDLATEVGRAEESDTSADGLKGTPLADRYELLEEIGRGGFAVVHRARDRKLDRIVAVKRLLPEKLSDSQSRQTIERFAREARVIASLNHRNIVQVFDHDQDDEGHYIVMELVDGGSLRKYLREHGKLPLADAVRLLRGVCQGLSTAHRRDLVHRDIKPANILLKHEGEELLTKIVDFGLARAGRDSDTSKTGYGLGTPFYMPPEQRRDAKNVNHTADIYAVGKMLYEMVTGEVPDNVDPQSIPPDPGLASIIFRCIKNCREERYFSVAELIADLDEVAGGISPAKMQRASAGAANQCPNCGAANPEDVKFCEDCGNGLTRLCPECERENSIHKTFCGECGTDLGGFLQAQEALQRMQTHAGEKRWSRVTKEFCLLHVPMRLLGKKGKQLWTEINEQNAEAKSKLEQRDELKHRIHRAIEEGDYEQALHLTTRCQEVDPHQTEVNELPEILHEKMDDRSYRRVRDTASGAVAVGDVDGARRAMSSYLEQYPTGRHATEAAKILSEELAPLSALGGLRLRMEAYEFDVALAAISEIERKGAAQKDSQAAILGTGPSPYEILNEAR
ncbi:MAG: protein kinase, partial [Lentisphaerae bacterium]|nr:protein kinase [Lentisphaerota bacterium]